MIEKNREGLKHIWGGSHTRLCIGITGEYFKFIYFLIEG